MNPYLLLGLCTTLFLHEPKLSPEHLRKTLEALKVNIKWINWQTHHLIHRNYKLHSKGNCKVCYIFLSYHCFFFFGSERTIDNHWRISHCHLQNGSLWIIEQCLKCQTIAAEICPIQAKVQLHRREGIFMDSFPRNLTTIRQFF